MVWISAVTACVAFVVVSVMKTLLGLRAEGQGCDLGGYVRGRGGTGHDGCAG